MASSVKALEEQIGTINTTIANLSTLMEKVLAMQANQAQAAKIIEPHKANKTAAAAKPVRNVKIDVDALPWRLELEEYLEFRSTCRPNKLSRWTGERLEELLGKKSGFAEGQLYRNWRDDASEEEALAVWKSCGFKNIPDGM
jgi:hypothetical protein